MLNPQATSDHLRVDVCRANLRHFSCPRSLDSIVTQDEKYAFYINPAKQLVQEVGQRHALIRPQRFKRLILFDNATPRRVKVTTQKLAQLGYVRVLPPPYSPDISPCDYHIFFSLQDFLARRDTRSQADFEKHVNQWINSRKKQFWEDGIRKLAERW
ncbi:hypothetical protein Q1695_005145 [Nippostrongylus brasiliensis]|nr:hypothetical protein Q1695_005145 [Nippostrongylus brasiliensis]